MQLYDCSRASVPHRPLLQWSGYLTISTPPKIPQGVNMDHEMFSAPDGKFLLPPTTLAYGKLLLAFPGLANRWLQITLPITPKHLLYISREGRGSSYSEILPDMADYLNWRTVGKCSEYFISPAKEIDPSWHQNESAWLRQLFDFGVKDP
jgi:hypothetical protein